MRNVPTHCNLLFSERAEALAVARGDLVLAFCPACGHVFNTAFDPSRMHYTQQYENSLHFSPRFQQFVEAQAAGLIARYDLHGKTIVDVGCGKGDFLKLICEMGGNHGVGFDPSYVFDGAEPPHVRFVQDFYSEKHTDVPADLVCCRQVLEHIEDPARFVAMVKRAAGARQANHDQGGVRIFFEVPNVLYTLRDLGIWDLIYEHVSYFSPASLRRLFEGQGMRVLDVAEVYGGQFLTLDAALDGAPGDAPAPLDSALPALVETFAASYAQKLAGWRAWLAGLRAAGGKAVAWGAGSKGVTFLNVLGAGDEVSAIVDINPRKQGMLVAGTGQRIVPPDALPELRPDAVLIMNPLYVSEIQSTVHGLGLKPDFHVV
ncbi:MAG: methyltransferase domain-containing protein [Anaerolineae bacterium]|nr:methyltransferase domain-containing protein [Anaerolineae bacterium]